MGSYKARFFFQNKRLHYFLFLLKRALRLYIYIHIYSKNLLLENLFPRVECRRKEISKGSKKEGAFICIFSNEVKPLNKQTNKKKNTRLTKQKKRKKRKKSQREERKREEDRKFWYKKQKNKKEEAEGGKTKRSK